MSIGTNQNRCLKRICTNEALRESGCFICSNETGDEKCVTCLKGYVLYYGTCVNCSKNEKCPFNNTGKVKCVDGDYSHCGFGSVGCKNHQCDMKGRTAFIWCTVSVIIIVIIGIIALKIRSYLRGYRPIDITETEPLF